MLTFALVGNQNCGKTTLFNALTGSKAETGGFMNANAKPNIGNAKANTRPFDRNFAFANTLVISIIPFAFASELE